MSFWSFLPVAFLLLRRKDDLIKLWQLLSPVLDAWKQVEPAVMEIAKPVFAELKIELAKLDQTTTHYDLAWVQRELNNLGYDAGNADGKMGPRTEAAVRAFQTANGLRVDGDPGPITRAWLYSKGQS